MIHFVAMILTFEFVFLPIVLRFFTIFFIMTVSLDFFISLHEAVIIYKLIYLHINVVVGKKGRMLYRKENLCVLKYLDINNSLKNGDYFKMSSLT